MKVYINKYKNNWISPYTILEKIYFWREIDYDEPIIDKLSSILLPFCEFYHWIANKVNRKIDYVKIDGWDTWSMDTTLSRIILPMLKQLQATKHGAPSVHDDDVPLALKSTMAPPKKDEWDTDDNYFRRWDYVLDEMIFAFEHLVDDSWEEEFWSGEHGTGKTITEQMESSTRKWNREGQKLVEDRINNGLRLFGKYYRALWD